MSNGLIVPDPSTVESVERLGAMIATGGLYGCKNKEQGQTLVLMSMAEGLPITEMKRRYHIINTTQGSTLTMRADYMLAEFRRLGGKFHWVDQGDDGQKATLHVNYATNDIDVTFTIDDAKLQGLVKDKSNWVKNPGAMLRSKAITKAVRMVCPEVLAGFATEDEIVNDGESVIDSPSVQQSVASPSATSTEVPHAVESPAESSPSEGEKATGPQIQRLTELFDSMGLTAEIQLKAITSTGARDMGDLTTSGAAEIITKLESALPKESDSSGSTAEQQERLKDLINRLAQQKGGAELVQRFKQHMESQGTPKFADLSAQDADRLIASLQSDDPSCFTELAFEGHSKND